MRFVSHARNVASFHLQHHMYGPGMSGSDVLQTLCFPVFPLNWLLLSCLLEKLCTALLIMYSPEYTIADPPTHNDTVNLNNWITILVALCE